MTDKILLLTALWLINQISQKLHATILCNEALQVTFWLSCLNSNTVSFDTICCTYRVVQVDPIFGLGFYELSIEEHLRGRL